jgi:hypothetical protein
MLGVLHAKPDLRVVLKWMINRSGSVITDVIPLEFWILRTSNIYEIGDRHTCDNVPSRALPKRGLPALTSHHQQNSMV